MRFAYADPPYLGMGKRYDHPESAVYDTIDGHHALIRRLYDEFPDGWAYSLSSTSLRALLPLCREDVRVGAWVKPWCSFKPGVNPAYAWEPVIWRGGRKRQRREPKVRDWVSVVAHQSGFFGSKPPEFCWWLFNSLGMQPEDDFVDMFPGSNAVGRAWEEYRRVTLAGGPLFV